MLLKTFLHHLLPLFSFSVHTETVIDNIYLVILCCVYVITNPHKFARFVFPQNVIKKKLSVLANSFSQVIQLIRIRVRIKTEFYLSSLSSASKTFQLKYQ